MKKVLLLGAMAAVAMSASAQFTVEPGLQRVLDQNPTKVWGIVVADGAVAKIEAAGAQYEYIGPDANAGRNLWYWEQTFTANEQYMPRVDEEDGDPINVVVADKGWSGAGLAVDAPGLNLDQFNDNTKLHFAYATCGTAPASVALIVLDSEKEGSKPAKIAVGADFSDNGAVYPSVGPAFTEDWQGVEISLGDLKKLYPSFDLQNKAAWSGNLLSFLGGGVTGQTFALDAIYFYTCETIGDAVDVVVDDNAAAEYYTVDGVKVANPEEGQLYIVVKGGKASKVIL